VIAQQQGVAGGLLNGVVVAPYFGPNSRHLIDRAICLKADDSDGADEPAIADAIATHFFT
jgi:hypothetical protein